MYSYNIEQASRYDGSSIITVVVNEKGVELDGALAWFIRVFSGRHPTESSLQCIQISLVPSRTSYPDS
jgi:hypothetical protein